MSPSMFLIKVNGNSMEDAHMPHGCIVVGDIHRFRSLDHLCSFCGLSPNSYSSGEHERVRGLSRRGNATIKHMIIECAWMAIRKDPVLLLYYKSVLPRMNANKAIIKVTRKLLARIRAVLHKQQTYIIGG
ncbi:IS110 family transposase [Chitinophaga sp. XS-30]|nr:IS110 family transposase [Chitinophaga sp. XS-30]